MPSVGTYHASERRSCFNFIILSLTKKIKRDCRYKTITYNIYSKKTINFQKTVMFFLQNGKDKNQKKIYIKLKTVMYYLGTILNGIGPEKEIGQLRDRMKDQTPAGTKE